MHEGRNLAYYLITLLTIKPFYILGIIAFYFALRYTGIDEKSRFWLSSGLGFSSLYFPWSAVFNNHSLAASFLAIGFFYFLRAEHESGDGKHFFLAALFLSLAGITDVPTAVFYTGFFIYLLVHPLLRRNIPYYLVPLLITALPAICLNYAISGNLLPVAVHKSFFYYPGSIWIKLGGLSGTDINSWPFILQYGLSSLFGPKGFVLYNPLLVIAVPFLISEIISQRKFRKEALTIGLCSLILISYYFVMTNNYAGGSYSIRWFVPLLPPLFFFAYPYFEKITISRQRLFLALFVIAGIISIIGVIRPWTDDSFPMVSNARHQAYVWMDIFSFFMKQL